MYNHKIYDSFEVFNNQIIMNYDLKEKIEIKLPKHLFYKFLFELKESSLENVILKESKITAKIIGFDILNFRVRIKKNARN